MSYISEVVADSPDAFWLLNEQSGTSAFDYNERFTTHTFTGTYAGSPTLGSVGLMATGYAVQTGAASYVRLPLPTGGLGTNVTIEFWFEYVSGGILFGNDTTSGGWRFDVSGTNPMVTAAGGSHTFTGVTSASLKTGVHHIVITLDAGLALVTLYVDGVSKGTFTGTSPNIGSTFYLGKDGLNSTFSPCVFAAFAVYGKTLSATRITAHYDAAAEYELGTALIGATAESAPVATPGVAAVAVTAMPIPSSSPVVTRSTLVLASSTVSDVVTPLITPGVTVEPLHIVAYTVPAPTLVDGRPT